MRYSIPVHYLSPGQIRNLLSFGKWGIHKSGVEFFRWDIMQAIDYVGKDIVHATPEFIEYDGIIAVDGEWVHMEYYDTMLDKPQETTAPLKWCLEYLLSIDKIDEFEIDEDEPKLSQVMVTYYYPDIDSDKEKTLHEYASDFILNLDEPEKKAMLIAWHMEEKYNTFQRIQKQPIEIEAVLKTAS